MKPKVHDMSGREISDLLHKPTELEENVPKRVEDCTVEELADYFVPSHMQGVTMPHTNYTMPIDAISFAVLGDARHVHMNYKSKIVVYRESGREEVELKIYQQTVHHVGHENYDPNPLIELPGLHEWAHPENINKEGERKTLRGKKRVYRKNSYNKDQKTIF